MHSGYINLLPYVGLEIWSFRLSLLAWHKVLKRNYLKVVKVFNQIMGSASSRGHAHDRMSKQVVDRSGKEANTNADHDPETLTNGDKSRVTTTSHEPDRSISKVVPSYSWLVSAPVDFDTTAKELNEKSKQPIQPRREKSNNEIKYCNGTFMKYCQLYAAELPPSNTKRSALSTSSTSSSSSGSSLAGYPYYQNQPRSQSQAFSGSPKHEANKETKHAKIPLSPGLGKSEDARRRRNSIQPVGFGVERIPKFSKARCQGSVCDK